MTEATPLLIRLHGVCRDNRTFSFTSSMMATFRTQKTWQG